MSTSSSSSSTCMEHFLLIIMIRGEEKWCCIILRVYFVHWKRKCVFRWHGFSMWCKKSSNNNTFMQFYSLKFIVKSLLVLCLYIDRVFVFIIAIDAVNCNMCIHNVICITKFHSPEVTNINKLFVSIHFYWQMFFFVQK